MQMVLVVVSGCSHLHLCPTTPKPWEPSQQILQLPNPGWKRCWKIQEHQQMVWSSLQAFGFKSGLLMFLCWSWRGHSGLPKPGKNEIPGVPALFPATLWAVWEGELLDYVLFWPRDGPNERPFNNFLFHFQSHVAWNQGSLQARDVQSHIPKKTNPSIRAPTAPAPLPRAALLWNSPNSPTPTFECGKIPAPGREGGTGWSLRCLQPQTILGRWNSIILGFH